MYLSLQIFNQHDLSTAVTTPVDDHRRWRWDTSLSSWVLVSSRKRMWVLTLIQETQGVTGKEKQRLRACWSYSLPSVALSLVMWQEVWSIAWQEGYPKTKYTERFLSSFFFGQLHHPLLLYVSRDFLKSDYEREECVKLSLKSRSETCVCFLAITLHDVRFGVQTTRGCFRTKVRPLTSAWRLCKRVL